MTKRGLIEALNEKFKTTDFTGFFDDVFYKGEKIHLRWDKIIKDLNSRSMSKDYINEVFEIIEEHIKKIEGNNATNI